MGCPVNIISKATLRGTARPTATPGVVQNSPTWTLQASRHTKDKTSHPLAASAKHSLTNRIPCDKKRKKKTFGMECSSVGQSIRPAHHQCRFDSLVRQGIFLLESTFRADSLTVIIYPHVQSHTFTSVRTSKIL